MKRFCRMVVAIVALGVGLGVVMSPLAFAEHALRNDRPYCDEICHKTAGRAGTVVVGTRLIGKDLRMVEILQAGAPNNWTSGSLPCAYCHQDPTGIRNNMTGIKAEFANATLSKHPSPALKSVGDVAGQLDCVDCHTNVGYVGGGDALNPNIHGVNAGIYGWTGAPGGVNVTATFLAKTWNTAGNPLCANYCHGASQADPLGESFATAARAHTVRTGLVSIEGFGTAFTTKVRGCLDDGTSQRGCHGSHGVANNTSLVALKWGSNAVYGGTYARQQDCGICHTFDDPPSNRAASAYYQDGHGKLSANNIKCVSCHDSSIPHFTAAGAPSGNRLQYVEDATLSTFSSPPESSESICLTSGCHDGYSSHTGAMKVGCNDCHSVHGYTVGSNLAMMRMVLPVANPTQNLYFQTSTAYYNSAKKGIADTYTGWLCDNRDCHGVIGGPGPIGNLMNSTTGAFGLTKHSGGTGTYDCAGCHTHGDGGGSWRALTGGACDSCHGQPPQTNVVGGPDGYASEYAVSGHFKDESKTPHARHSAYYSDCGVCHLKYSDSTYHATGSSGLTFRNVIFNTGRNPNALPENVAAMRSPSYAVTASVPNSCLNLYCHSDGQNMNRYSTMPAANMAWDAVTSNDPTCEGCHGGVKTDAKGSYLFGAPDYPTPGAGDKTATVGSSVAMANVKSNSHYSVTLQHSRYACSVCHQGTVTDAAPNVTTGWNLAASLTDHVNGLRDVSFLAASAGASAVWNSANLTCATVLCHSRGEASRDATYSAPANRVATYARAYTWGANLTCNSCHAGDKATLATGSHAVHLNSATWPQGVTLACPDCHSAAGSTQHADGVVQFSLAGSVVPLTNTKICDGCHGGTAAAATAKSFWYNPGYGNYADGGVTCESCHGGAANLSAVLGSTAGRVTTNYLTRGHGSTVDLPWTDADTSVPNLDCVECHGWKDKHILAADSYNRPANTIAGAAFTSTNSETWCVRCHDGAPARTVTTHHNGTGNREAAFTMRCNACHNPHGSANIFMVAATVTNTAAVMDTKHAVSFLNTHAYHAQATSNTAVCKVCHVDGSTSTTYNKGGENSAIHANYKDQDCVGCHAHNNPSDGGFMASCTGCHGSGSFIWPQGSGRALSTSKWPNRKGNHPVHLDALEVKLSIPNAVAYGVWSTNTASQLRMCRYCHYGVPGEGGHDTNGATNYAANVGSFNPMWDLTNPPTVLDGGTAAVFNSLAANKTCSDSDCHYDKTAGAQVTPAWYNTATKATCAYCHPFDTATYPTAVSGAFTLPNAHAKHVDETGDLGYDYTCMLCHSASTGYADNHANGNVKSSIAFSSYAAVDVSGAVQATYASNTKICANVYCHGNTGLPDWNAGLTVACGSCHGDANGRPDTANEPTGGNHQTASHVRVCVRCHVSDNTNRANHAHGPYNTVATAQINTAAAGSITSYSYGAAQSGSSPDPDGLKYTHGLCTPTCHAAANWGGSGGCSFCHGYPPITSHASGVTAVVHSKTGMGKAEVTGNHNDCQYCHGLKDAGDGTPFMLSTGTLAGTSKYRYSWTTNHNKGTVDLNGNNDATGGNDCGYDGANGWCATATCHSGDTQHAVGTGNLGSGKLQLRDLGTGSCQSCHGASSPDAGVGTASSHLMTVRGGATTGGNCDFCHTSHTGGLFIIRNSSNAGIHFTASGNTGISLGNASGAKGTTEAEICWRCHSKTTHTGGKISEWGINTDTNGTGRNYNLGYVTKSGGTGTVAGTGHMSNWVWDNGTTAQAYSWQSAYGAVAGTIATYKEGNILSTHSANATSGVSGIDRPRFIRCSWCHDVHNTVYMGPNASGKPFLRGPWKGNPYREDVAPVAKITYTAVNSLGAVPRGATAMSAMGGWQIDQNNGNPTSAWSATSFGGLCEKCHGGGGGGTINDGSFTAAEVAALNVFGISRDSWIGTNGHGQSVKGGAKTYAKNVYNENPDRATTALDITSNGGGHPIIVYRQTTGRGFGFRSFVASGWSRTPKTTAVYAWSSYNLGATWNNQATMDTQFHKFSCSKCHNPHASRLPRLMITNCLDTKKNTWDTKSGVSLVPSLGTTNAQGLAVSVENANVALSNATSAANCHRKADTSAYTNARGSGWNKVTPW